MAKFLLSSPSVELCPPPTLPEFAFIGRSNVGKSSLMNMLMADRLALTSGTPGKTKLLNWFQVKQANWIDLPGYGYAKAGKEDRKAFAELIVDFFERRKTLVCTFVLIDIRHAALEIDLEFMEFLMEREVPFAMVFTKADKLKPTQAAKHVEDYMNLLLTRWEGLPPHFATSAEKRTGRDQMLAYLEELTVLGGGVSSKTAARRKADADDRF